MPLINISLDVFALVILFIIFLSIVSERPKKESNSLAFLTIIISIILTLIADIIAWIGEGNVNLSMLTLVGSVLASCFAYLTIPLFMHYMKINLYPSSKLINAIILLISLLCMASILVLIMNIFENRILYVNDLGHFALKDNIISTILYLIVPMISFCVMFFMTLMGKGVTLGNRLLYFLNGLFPILGATIDFFFHGWSVTYLAFVICAVVLYTSIYVEKRKIISEQKTALMLSQINPHFMYNTLTTIASMCDVDPRQARNLTIEFSSYLRQNIGTLSENKLIPFVQEMKHVDTYLTIEKARFGDRINVIHSIQSENFMIPPLTVQPIVENAIKHGITKKISGGTVRITSYSDEKNYIIDIIDDGVGFDTDTKQITKDHVGLTNVRNRLRSTCKGTLEIKSMIDVGTRVTITIPKKEAKIDEHTGS